jgi:hypothetical protein
MPFRHREVSLQHFPIHAATMRQLSGLFHRRQGPETAR